MDNLLQELISYLKSTKNLACANGEKGHVFLEISISIFIPLSSESYSKYDSLIQMYTKILS